MTKLEGGTIVVWHFAFVYLMLFGHLNYDGSMIQRRDPLKWNEVNKNRIN